MNKLLTLLASVSVIVYHLLITVSSKPMRLPMLMRDPTVECNFQTDTCGINQTLEQFEYQINQSSIIDGRFEYYQLAIKPDYAPRHMGRFQTLLFPNLGYSEGCVHVEYNVRGANDFLFSIIQQQIDFPKQKIQNFIVFNHWVSPSLRWKRIDINVTMNGSGSEFIFEAFCENCLYGSKFSVSRLLFSWSSCDRQTLPSRDPSLMLSDSIRN